MVSPAAVDVASRAAAAALGGYALANAAAALGAVVLPLTRAEAVTWATMFAFMIYLAAIVWAFAARDAWRAWLGLGAPALACLAAALAIGPA